MRFWFEGIRAALTWQILALVLGGWRGLRCGGCGWSGGGMPGNGCGNSGYGRSWRRMRGWMPGCRWMGMFGRWGRGFARRWQRPAHFGRVAMLVRDADGRLYVTASSGMDDRMVQASGRLVRAGGEDAAGSGDTGLESG